MQTRKTDEDLAGNIQRRPSRYGAYLDGCKEICQRQTKMEKARCPMFQQELEELRSKVRNNHKTVNNELNVVRLTCHKCF